MSVAQAPAGTLSSRLGGLRRLLGDRVGFALLLLLLMVLAAASETVGVSMVLPIISSVAGIPAGAGKLGAAVDALRGALPDAYEMQILLGVLAAAFLAKAALSVATLTLTEYFALRLRSDWTARLYRHYLASPHETLLREQQGTLIHNLTVEPLRAGQGMALLLNLMNRAVMTVVLVSILLFVSWQATLGVAVLGGAIFYAMRRWSWRYSLRFGEEHLKLQQEVSALGAEAIAAGIEVRLFGAAERVTAEVLGRLGRQTRAEATFSIVKEMPVQMTEFVLVLVLAAPLVVLTSVLGIAPATYAATLMFFLVVAQRLLSNFAFLMSVRMKLLAHVPSLRLIDRVLRAPSEQENVETGARFTGLDGDIVLRGVTFGYGQGRDVLHGVTMTLPRGRTTALVGPSGIGKSTIADLLLGLVRPRAGSVRLGSRGLEEFSLSSLRQGIGYVSQHPVIFNATVRDNLRFGAPHATDAEIAAATRLARADGFIARLPQGYDTQLGDRGASLSGGERQRLAIARVIVRRPSIYVFDEATSALDPESEALVRDAIRALAEDATVLVIAHRPSAVAGADVVYRLGAEGVRQIGQLDEGLAGVGA